jgi:hypothetical protein
VTIDEIKQINSSVAACICSRNSAGNVMDYANSRNKRMRVDYEYAQPLSIADYAQLLSILENEEYAAGTEGSYAIKHVNSVLIRSEPYGKGVDVTVYMNVDLAEKIG